MEYHAPDSRTGKVRHGATINHDFGQDARMAARAAPDVFVNVYGLPANIQLTISERQGAGLAITICHVPGTRSDLTHQPIE